MRVLIIQENGRHEANRNYRECFCLQRGFKFHGVQADVWGLAHQNYDQVPVWDDYDLIINLENYDQTGWVPDLAEVRTKKFLWSIDAHVKGIRSYIQTATSGKYDLILQATPEFLSGHHSIWFPNCYDDELIIPKNVAPHQVVHDVGFCGNINNRAGLFTEMEKYFEFKLDEFVIGDAMVNSINRYKVHLNCNIGIDINYRNFETMGCSTFLLTSYNQHYAALGIRDGLNCFTYSTLDEMVSKTRQVLQDGDLRLELAERGYELVKSKHTYKHRAQQILEAL